VSELTRQVLSTFSQSLRNETNFLVNSSFPADMHDPLADTAQRPYSRAYTHTHTHTSITWLLTAWVASPQTLLDVRCASVWPLSSRQSAVTHQRCGREVEPGGKASCNYGTWWARSIVSCWARRCRRSSSGRRRHKHLLHGADDSDTLLSKHSEWCCWLRVDGVQSSNDCR